MSISTYTEFQNLESSEKEGLGRPAFMTSLSSLYDHHHIAVVQSIIAAKSNKIRTLMNLSRWIDHTERFAKFIRNFVLRAFFVVSAKEWMFFSGNLTFRSPALLDHVSDIIQGSTEKKMIGSHARRIVTFVAHIQFWIKWTICQFIRISMGEHCSGPISWLSDLPVPTAITIAGPNPTTRPLFDLFPKTFFHRSAFCHDSELLLPSYLNVNGGILCR
jgi:hypothetical protein